MNNKFLFLVLVLLVQFFLKDIIFASESVDSNKVKVNNDTAESKTIIIKPTSTDNEGLDTTSFNVNEIKFIGYPYAFYTPETQFALGLGGMIYFRTALQSSQRPSKITFGGYYTTNNQYLISLKPRIYFPGKKRFYLESDFYYSYFIGKYCGIGSNSKESENDDYKASSFGILIETQIRGILLNFLQFGLIYDYSNIKIKDKMNNLNLSDSSVKGIDGGKVGGLGLSWMLDYRDNISYPSKGGLYKISGIFYGRSLGGDFTYNRYKIDLRQYVSLISDHILAFQFYTDLSTGSSPFFSMPALGGSSRMRGYYEGRYRDKNYVTGQIEYRKIVWWRIGINAFYAAGNVFGHSSQLKISDIKQSYGFGLRFVFDTKEKINLRVDFGKTNESTGIYFSVDEAF